MVTIDHLVSFLTYFQHIPTQCTYVTIPIQHMLACRTTVKQMNKNENMLAHLGFKHVPESAQLLSMEQHMCMAFSSVGCYQLSTHRMHTDTWNNNNTIIQHINTSLITAVTVTDNNEFILVSETIMCAIGVYISYRRTVECPF